MNPFACPAAKLPEVDRKSLAIQALAGTATITDLAAQNVVSRKFVYEQVNKTSAALVEVFTSSAPDDAVLFELPVTKIWLRQLKLGLSLICRGSYRGVVELMRDLLGVRISEGTIHNVHQTTALRVVLVWHQMESVNLWPHPTINHFLILKCTNVHDRYIKLTQIKKPPVLGRTGGPA